MDYIPYGKNLNSYSPRTSIFNNPRPAIHCSRYHHQPDEFLTEVRQQLIILIQALPPLDEYLNEVREQLIIPSFTEQIPSIQDLQQESSDSQVFEIEHLLFLHTPNICIEWTYSPPVICNDQAFTDFFQGEERCLKFINQDLTFLQSSNILSAFRNRSHAVSASTKIKESSCIQLPTHIPQENTNTLPTQTIEPVLGFTPVEIHRAQAEP